MSHLHLSIISGNLPFRTGVYTGMLTSNRRHAVIVRLLLWSSITLTIGAQTPAPQDPIDGIVKLFETYRIVMLG